jgi:hypothetical protein
MHPKLSAEDFVLVADMMHMAQMSVDMEQASLVRQQS